MEFETAAVLALGAFSPPKLELVLIVLLTEFVVLSDALDLCKVDTDAGCVGLCHCVVLRT